MRLLVGATGLLLAAATPEPEPEPPAQYYGCSATHACVAQAGGRFNSRDECLNDGGCAGPAPPPPPSVDPPTLCDLRHQPDGVTLGCSCDGYDLSAAKGQVIRTAPDSDGYTFVFSICAEIPREALPRGCKGLVDNPAALAYRHDNPEDCRQVGGLGPCDEGEAGPCGMFGAYDSGSGATDEMLTLSYKYSLGCNNTFVVELRDGDEPRPASAVVQGSSALCDYTVPWPGMPLQRAPVQPQGLPVPTVKLTSQGLQMPLIAMGTGSGQKGEVAAATKLWLAQAGGTAIDTAFQYSDQLEIQSGISDAILDSFGQIPQMFLETKIPCGPDYATAMANLNANLAQLGVDQVDLTLMHSPCRGETATDDTAVTWKAMEDFLDAGKAQAIGVSNFKVDQLKALAETSDHTPSLMQSKLSVVHHGARLRPHPLALSARVCVYCSAHIHVCGTDDATILYCKKAGIVYQAYSPLCGGFNGSSCSHGGGQNVMTVPEVVAIAGSHHKSPAQVGLKWVVQQGHPLVTAVWDLEYMIEDLDLWSWTLTAAEMATLTAVAAPKGPPSPAPDKGDGHKKGSGGAVAVIIVVIPLLAVVGAGGLWRRRRKEGGEGALLQDHLDEQLGGAE